MPIYEYFCEDCRGVFELIRPVRQVGQPQPCPSCDNDAKPIVSRDFQAFILREGLPRRLPDRGTYWHLNKEVSSPVKEAAPPGEHPELRRKKVAPDRPPTVEEMERFEVRVNRRLEREATARESGMPVIRDVEEAREETAFVQRAVKTARQARLESRRDPNAKATPRTRTGKHTKES